MPTNLLLVSAAKPLGNAAPEAAPQTTKKGEPKLTLSLHIKPSHKKDLAERSRGTA